MNGVTVGIILFMVVITITTAMTIGPRYEAFQKYIFVIKVFLGVLVTIPLLTNKRRIFALLWVMVISLGFFGFKGGIWVIAHGGAGGRIQGPPGSMIYDNNQLAVALLVTLPLMNAATWALTPLLAVPHGQRIAVRIVTFWR